MLVPFLPESEGGAGIAAILLVALAVDAAMGDPKFLWRAVPHPVAAIGKLIALIDARWNDPGQSGAVRRRRGAWLVAGLVAAALMLGWGIEFGLRIPDHGWIIEGVLASILIASRGLYDHVRRVAAALETGVEQGRDAVAHIVGRDPQSLDEAGIARAAIESAAENFADGVIAPVFWFAVGGLPGLCACKVINTLDSMIGYTTPDHAAFGRAAARTDDVANWLPARLTGTLIGIVAFALPGAGGRAAFRAMGRDAAKHRSPNAGWPEAAMAGALGLALAGPRHYGGEEIPDAWMGDGRRDAHGGDIGRAQEIALAAFAVVAAVVAAAALI
jgi:adenosylcobinamide-phosphate synthase